MPSHRSLRMAEAIREVVSSAILFEVADPRVSSVTVINVELSRDLRNATILVSIMGSPADQDRSMSGLKHASGFIQARVAARLQTRFTPAIFFKRDESVKKSIEISRLIDTAIASDRKPESDEPEVELDSEPETEPEPEPEGDSGPDHP
ncbi:ribosome-binding factor A [Singulisphaera sp. GP187]|uniref:30S ribosome-binding factor RbfA n=1 Tax=Singulisphaera sp. GP187 TaxID=1882752 RepID=UPI00092994A6|nr:30S ribosome-binding factor RbfA [Singulisphaera sp. GP187]SIN88811.1 ribosome-binding factor A [Singulisphaera sp. GP187]